MTPEADRHALAERFTAAAPRLMVLLARKHGIEYDLARDALQHTMLRMLEKDPPVVFESESHFVGYVLSAARNYAVDEVRKKRRLTDETGLALLADIDPSALDKLISEEQVVRLREALKGLEESYREAIKLLIYDELPISKIAEVLGMERASVYKRIQRGIEQLRRNLERSR